jgi:nitrate/nitrite transport system ATP-binding protein
MTAVKLKVVDINAATQKPSPSNDAYQPLVELKNVCKAYGEGKDKTSILKNINLTVKEGEFIAISFFPRNAQPINCPPHAKRQQGPV